MAEVSIRDLRNHGGEVVERARQGERLTITRAGRPVAQLTALPGPPRPLETVLERRRRLPAVDPVRLLADVDVVADPAV